MFDGATDGSFRGLFIQGEDLSQIPTRITSSTLCVRWTLSSCRTCSSMKQRHLPTSSFPGPTAVFAGTSRNISYREAIFSYSNPNSRTLASSIPLSIEVIISLALPALTSLRERPRASLTIGLTWCALAAECHLTAATLQTPPYRRGTPAILTRGSHEQHCGYQSFIEALRSRKIAILYEP